MIHISLWRGLWVLYSVRVSGRDTQLSAGKERGQKERGKQKEEMVGERWRASELTEVCQVQERVTDFDKGKQSIQ